MCVSIITLKKMLEALITQCVNVLLAFKVRTFFKMNLNIVIGRDYRIIDLTLKVFGISIRLVIFQLKILTLLSGFLSILNHT